MRFAVKLVGNQILTSSESQILLKENPQMIFEHSQIIDFDIEEVIKLLYYFLTFILKVTYVNYHRQFLVQLSIFNTKNIRFDVK